MTWRLRIHSRQARTSSRPRLILCQVRNRSRSRMKLSVRPWPLSPISQSVSVTNATQSNADILCSLFVASSGGCPDLYSCAVVNGETGCVQDVKSDIPGMMIWVATGVSVFIIIVIVLVAVIIIRCRRNRKRRIEGRSSRYMGARNRHSHDRKRSELTTNAPYGRHGPKSARLPSRSISYHSNLGFDGTVSRVTLDDYPRLPGPGHKQIDRHSHDRKRSEVTTNAPYGRHGPKSAGLPSRSMAYHSNLGFDGTESRVTLDHYPRLPGSGHKQIDRHSHYHKRSELTTNAPYGRHGPKSARLPSRSMPYHSNLGFDGIESQVTLE